VLETSATKVASGGQMTHALKIMEEKFGRCHIVHGRGAGEA
jgi:hypothetical protein